MKLLAAVPAESVRWINQVPMVLFLVMLGGYCWLLWRIARED